ncbi:MAG: dTDP-4-dehydrorhamnose reductase [Thiomicrospira sp.]|uniref:dTDP-4-dehydrorhamnose reductase n=1 Tax=Thiomicrospira sp. TaxID=935 RepID=UPI0019E1D305|nr:dTDP-4-dehydrorhamnose reductase [Thiomicrospira sp.]MBE0494609.1 dTDP-4-dehydrorhamnose reductase [Thiomicrospira sp.]
MRLLLLGANGQLGQCFKQVSAGFPEFEIQAYGRELDITQPGLVAEVLHDSYYDVVINCAAYNQVDLAEVEPNKADAVNHLAVRHLAELVKQQGGFLVHFSTDYVFDGLKNRPYLETDQPFPLNVYGQTKLAGENAMLAVNPPGLVVRTSWLFSPFSSNFLTRMRQLGATRSSIQVVSDQIGSPTCALDLAQAVFDIVSFRQKTLDENPNHQAWWSTQVCHFANKGQASWAELATEIMRLSELDCKVLPISTADYGVKACRPAYSVLDATQIQAWLPGPIRSWREALGGHDLFLTSPVR